MRFQLRKKNWTILIMHPLLLVSLQFKIEHFHSQATATLQLLMLMLYVAIIQGFSKNRTSSSFIYIYLFGLCLSTYSAKYVYVRNEQEGWIKTEGKILQKHSKSDLILFSSPLNIKCIKLVLLYVHPCCWPMRFDSEKYYDIKR